MTNGIDCCEIPIGRGLVAIVDAEDFEMVSKLKWHLHEKHGIKYARHTRYNKMGVPKYSSVLLHRFIVDVPEGMIVDHINGDGLDNRKSNLRICTHRENLLNRSPRGRTSRYRGVYWHGKDRRWVATVTKAGKRVRIGGFVDEIEAAKAYDQAAIKLHGEFARLNFLPGSEVADYAAAQ